MIQSNHGLAINVFMISWRDSLNHFYPLLVLQAQILIGFSENWRKNGLSDNFGANFSHMKIQNYHGIAKKVLMIYWRDSLNHFYPLLVLQAQIIIGFSENWRKNGLSANFGANFSHIKVQIYHGQSIIVFMIP